MSHRLEFHKEWQDHHGAIVKIDGRNHTLRVRTYRARYPREEWVITVDAVPTNRRSKHYQDVRDQLGDDWSTDVLASDIELQCDILNQLQ